MILHAFFSWKVLRYDYLRCSHQDLQSLFTGFHQTTVFTKSQLYLHKKSAYLIWFFFNIPHNQEFLSSTITKKYKKVHFSERIYFFHQQLKHVQTVSHQQKHHRPAGVHGNRRPTRGGEPFHWGQTETMTDRIIPQAPEDSEHCLQRWNSQGQPSMKYERSQERALQDIQLLFNWQ